MVFGTCYNCFRYSVFFFNFLLWLLGCALLSVGAWLLMEEEGEKYVEEMSSIHTPQDKLFVISYSEVTETNIARPLAYLFLVFGTMLVLVAVIGCCGAVRNNVCLLVTFAILLSIVLVVLLGVGVWAFTASKKVNVHTTQLQQRINETLRSAVTNYYTRKSSKDFMDAVQSKLACCGVDKGYSDYVFRGPRDHAPCLEDHWQQPCLPEYFDYVAVQFEEFMRKRLMLVAALCIAFAICLVAHMLLVLLLCCAVKDRTRSINV